MAKIPVFAKAFADRRCIVEIDNNRLSLQVRLSSSTAC